jgi:hypothetical protein
MRGFLSWKDFRRWESHPNILERDYQLKAAMGFAPESFTRIRRLLRQRLATLPAGGVSPTKKPG